MAFTITHDETTPIDHSKFSTMPDAVRDTKVGFRERLQFGGMYFPSSHDELAGEHSYVRLANQGSAPSAVATKWMLYVTSSGLFIREPGGTSIQITNTTSVISSTPSGSIIAYGGSSAPSGFLLCDGSAVSRTTYADLFTAISTTYGIGDGASTFNVPDLRQRFPLGKAASGTGSTLAGTGGAIDHTHTGPSHTHTGPSHTHTVPASSASWGQTTAVGGKLTTGQDGGTSASTDAATSSSGTGATGASGTGDTGTGNPPYLVVNYIIKT